MKIKLFEQFINDNDGVWVRSDNNKDRLKIKNFIDKSEYYGEWDEQAGAFWFPESVDNLDRLEMELAKEFDKLRIKSYSFEATI